MRKIFIQTSNEQFKKLVEQWRKSNKDISEELVKLVSLALQTGIITIPDLSL